MLVNIPYLVSLMLEGYIGDLPELMEMADVTREELDHWLTQGCNRILTGKTGMEINHSIPVADEQELDYDSEVEVYDNGGKTGIDQWVGHRFESSSGLTEEFSQFSRDFKKHLKGAAGKAYKLVSYLRGHFEASAFFKNKVTGKYVYVSISDVRPWPDGWYNDVLVRTAQHEEDYTGGSNYSCRLPELRGMLDRLSA